MGVRKNFYTDRQRCEPKGLMLLSQHLKDTGETVEGFAERFNIKRPNLYYWMQNGAFYQEEDGIRRIILPKVVAEQRL